MRSAASSAAVPPLSSEELLHPDGHWSTAALAEPFERDGLEVLRAGSRVLISRGLSEAAQSAALALPERRFADLASYLAARPEVMERAARLRAGER